MSTKISARIDDNLAAKLKAAASRPGTNQRMEIEAALRAYLVPSDADADTEPGAEPAADVMGELAALNDAIAKLQDSNDAQLSLLQTVTTTFTRGGMRDRQQQVKAQGFGRR